MRPMTTSPVTALTVAVIAVIAGSLPARAQMPGPAQVSATTIEGECKIGEGGAGLYRSAAAHHSCKLYPAPVGSIFLVVDETGEGVDIALANRGAKLNTPDGTTATCGRGSMLILAVIAMTADTDGFERADYNAVCVPGPFKPGQ